MIIIDSHVLWEIIQRDLCTIYPISLSDNILHSCCIIITPRIMTSIQFRFPQLYMKWQPTPVFLHAESHGQRSLAGYSPWGCKELDATEWLTLCYMCVCNLVHTWMCSVQFYHMCPSLPRHWSVPALQAPHPSLPLLLWPHSQSLATFVLLSISIFLPFQECHIDETMEYITFGTGFFTVSIIPLRFIQVVCIYSLFLFIA